MTLSKAIIDMLDASKVEEEERSKYEGFDWSYHGFYHIQAKEKAIENFADALDETIDARVKLALESIVANISS